LTDRITLGVVVLANQPPPSQVHNQAVVTVSIFATAGAYQAPYQF